MRSAVRSLQLMLTSEHGEVFREPKLANAILDRILHHATVVTIVGESNRLKKHGSKRISDFVHP